MRTTTPSSPGAHHWAALFILVSGCAVPDKGGTWPDPPPPTLATPLGVDPSTPAGPEPDDDAGSVEVAAPATAPDTGAPTLPAKEDVPTPEEDAPTPEDGPTTPPPADGDPPSSI